MLNVYINFITTVKDQRRAKQRAKYICWIFKIWPSKVKRRQTNVNRKSPKLGRIRSERHDNLLSKMKLDVDARNVSRRIRTWTREYLHQKKQSHIQVGPVGGMRCQRGEVCTFHRSFLEHEVHSPFQQSIWNNSIHTINLLQTRHGINEWHCSSCRFWIWRLLLNSMRGLFILQCIQPWNHQYGAHCMVLTAISMVPNAWCSIHYTVVNALST